MSDGSSYKSTTLALEPRYDEANSVSAEDVRAFLAKNPEFFTQYPELLERLIIPHEQKGSVSLVELQGEQLRKKVRQLNYKLNQLIGIAKQNEKIYRVYTDLNVQLLTCKSVLDIQLKLEEVLQENLQLASVSLKLFKGPHALPELQRRLFAEKRFKKSQFFFGRLSQHEKYLLFSGDIAESVALIQLGDNNDLGILAVGSGDATHFTPDMDTLLLKQLQQVLNIIMPPMLGY
ncbi:DUF484 family protein [Alteromonas pelagimontana]|uniref:DUF484 family protein n=1 Tax=Alteromonas pelagimontana TaxID=1858656 RepID=A0A6M4MDN3_9ALTE|nr:DUF484 family protein [Alteromonas pelagimontana]QJR81219.1 DUF484 family protein [Alteromonas pelagimontana]